MRCRSKELLLEKKLSQALTEQLQSLNMPKASVSVKIEKTALTTTGQDQITLLLAANPGEAAIPVQSCASGGELSRLLLALKLLLKTQTPTFIFDEIDSNIGGQTATLIGQRLKALGKTAPGDFALHTLHKSQNVPTTTYRSLNLSKMDAR